MQRLNRLASIGLACAALIIAGATSASADDFFAGCSKDNNSKVKKVMVNSYPTCKPGETLRVWNQTGPQGPQGPPGAPGIPSSCHVELFPGIANANTYGVVNATCSSGFATGASAIWMTPYAAADNGRIYSYARNSTFWTIIAWNVTPVQHDIEVQLMCCS